LDVGVAVAAGVESDRGAQLAGLAAPVVAGVIDSADVDDDPRRIEGIRSRGITGLTPDAVGIGCCEHPTW
jgi:hypothetical protein